MRIWDIPPSELCRQHLLGEHRELHGLWNILTSDRPEERGYWNHPETQRWVGKLGALMVRHAKLVAEMFERGYKHRSQVELDLFKFSPQAIEQNEYITPPKKQRVMLRDRCEACKQRMESTHEN